MASDYLRLQELDREMEISVETTNSFGESLRIFTQRMEGGTASALETARAEAALDDAASAIPSIRQQIPPPKTSFRSCWGAPPDRLAERQPRSKTCRPKSRRACRQPCWNAAPTCVRRRDQLRSANAQVGQSVADFFPQVGLTALLGKISPQLSAFTLGSANAWGVAAEATGPLFEGGRLVGEYRQAKAARDEARLQYHQTFLTALRDVSDALIARERLEEIRGFQAGEVAALEQAVRVSTNRYVAGKASYYEVLEAQQQLFPAQLNLARTERDQQLAIVALYEALGGGWPGKVDAKGKDDDSEDVVSRSGRP